MVLNLYKSLATNPSLANGTMTFGYLNQCVVLFKGIYRYKPTIDGDIWGYIIGFITNNLGEHSSERCGIRFTISSVGNARCTFYDFPSGKGHL